MKSAILLWIITLLKIFYRYRIECCSDKGKFFKASLGFTVIIKKVKFNFLAKLSKVNNKLLNFKKNYLVKGYQSKEHLYRVNGTELFNRLKSLKDFTSLTEFLDNNLDMVQFILNLDQNLDGCLSNCSNRGRCELLSKQLKCNCQKDFEGEMCENTLFCHRFLILINILLED